VDNKDELPLVGSWFTGYSPTGHIDEYRVEQSSGGDLYLKGRFGKDMPISHIKKCRKGGILK